MSGAEIAEKMLADNGIRDDARDFGSGSIDRSLQPVNKTVNLSEAVYNQRNAVGSCGST
jgi:Zn-dependent membrane protease YugP